MFENFMFFKCQQKLLCIYSIDGGVHLKNSRFPADDVQSSGSRRAAHGISYTNTSYMCDEERAAAVKIVVKVQVKVGTRAHSV